MTEYLCQPCTAFAGTKLLSAGPLVEVALAVKTATDAGTAAPLLVFDDGSGKVLDFDLRGGKAEVIARLSRIAAMPATGAASDPVGGEPRGRGRPRLGVVGREVTLLPRQWDWLAAQPGGASVVLRRLVDAARRGGGDRQQRRAAQEAAYRFMSALAGDLPGYEEATRALFADDRGRFAQQVAAWPEDVRAYATRLAFGLPAAIPGEGETP
jgi:hypothetical protein